MGISYVPGALNISCATDCPELQHILLETDYEGYAVAYAPVVGSHEWALTLLRSAVTRYLDVVDGESTFFLQPLIKSPMALSELLNQIIEAEMEAVNG